VSRGGMGWDHGGRGMGDEASGRGIGAVRWGGRMRKAQWGFCTGSPVCQVWEYMMKAVVSGAVDG